jgi:predicted porin
MSYRTTFCFYAVMMSAAPVWAQQSQSTVTIYGLLDQGVERLSGTSAGNGTSTSDYRVGSGTAASRLGFRGSEDLGGGLKAVFTLESGMSMDAGTLSQGSRIFGRQSYVGLTGSFGSLTFGRQYTMRYYGILDADLFGAGSHGLGSLDSGIPNARADNSISYRGHWGDFSGGANFSRGRDAVGANNASATNCAGETANTKQCREWSAMAKYGNASWGVVGSYEKQHGGTAATFGGLTAPELTDSRVMVNSYLNVGESKFAVGWIKRNNDGSATKKSDLFWVVGSVPLGATAFSVDSMLAQLKFDDSPNKAVLFSLRGNYELSKRTRLYVSGAAVKNSGTLALAASTNAPATGPLPGGKQGAIMAGIRHTF